jgi:carbonic anhydrase/acetyltransferase-like protein (isoleucine patch superfamily)
MAIYQLDDDIPQIPESAYVAEEAVITGKVSLGEQSSVWPGAMIRGDNDPVTIGRATNVQEGAVLHTDRGCPLNIGDYVSIGHQAMLHGCTIGDGMLVGIQAIVLNKAVIGKDCLIAAGAIVTEGKVFPDRSLILGAPAKVVRELTDQDIAAMRFNAEDYAQRQEHYKTRLKRIG